MRKPFKEIFVKLGKPYLNSIYDDIYSPSITEDEITKFYSDLCNTLNKITERKKVSFPDKWVRALHNLGFRAGTKYSDIIYEYGDQ